MPELIDLDIARSNLGRFGWTALTQRSVHLPVPCNPDDPLNYELGDPFQIRNLHAYPLEPGFASRWPSYQRDRLVGHRMQAGASALVFVGWKDHGAQSWFLGENLQRHLGTFRSGQIGELNYLLAAGHCELVLTEDPGPEWPGAPVSDGLSGPPPRPPVRAVAVKLTREGLEPRLLCPPAGSFLVRSHSGDWLPPLNGAQLLEQVAHALPLLLLASHLEEGKVVAA